MGNDKNKDKDKDNQPKGDEGASGSRTGEGKDHGRNGDGWDGEA